jgi:hypothetical protein
MLWFNRGRHDKTIGALMSPPGQPQAGTEHESTTTSTSPATTAEVFDVEVVSTPPGRHGASGTKPTTRPLAYEAVYDVEVQEVTATEDGADGAAPIHVTADAPVWGELMNSLLGAAPASSPGAAPSQVTEASQGIGDPDGGQAPAGVPPKTMYKLSQSELVNWVRRSTGIEISEAQSEAATTIQRLVRGKAGRKRAKAWALKLAAARVVPHQQAWLEQELARAAR